MFSGAELNYTYNVNRGVKHTPLSMGFFTTDKQGHTFNISVVDDKGNVDLNGSSVVGWFIPNDKNLIDDKSIPLDGVAKGNVATVSLPEKAYIDSGRFSFIIQISKDNVTSTIFWATGRITRSKTDSIVDVDGVIPSLEDLLAQIATIKAATDLANSSAQRANEAAERAENLAIDANGYAANAGKLGGKLPSEYLGVNETAADSNKLGGRTADEYLLKTDLPETEEASGGAFVTPQMFVTLEDPYDADGVFIDKDAIQAAFDASSFVAFPEGRYRFFGVTCEHDVHVIFAGAELVPVHPTYDASASGGKVDEAYDHGVFENFFSFYGCSVTMQGLRMIRTEQIKERAEIYLKDGTGGYVTENGEKVVNPNIPPTRSIAEFEKCTNVILRDWHVRGLALFNRGKTPSAFADRKGIIFSAIDTDIRVENCKLENLQGDEWTWCTNRSDIYATKCTFDGCEFRAPFAGKENIVEDGNTYKSTKAGLSCVGIFLASEAIVQNCIFEDVPYYGSLANLAAFRGIFRNNTIVRCDVGGVCDFLEGSVGYITADDVIIEGNVMGNSTCGKFASMAARRAVIRGNSGIVADQFVFSTFPHTSHIFSTEGKPVGSIRILIEGNDVICTDATPLDDSNKAVADKAFIRFKFTMQNGVWVSGDSQAIVQNNRFVRRGKTLHNPCIVAANLTNLVVIGNVLFFGATAITASETTSVTTAYAVQTTASDITAQRVDLKDNIFSASLPSGTTAATRAGLRVSGSGVTSLNKLLMGNVLFPSGNINIESVSIATDATIKEVTSSNAGFAS